MGAKCCIPIKQSAQMNLRENVSHEISARRSKRFLRWDNRTHTEDVEDKNSGANVGMELKGRRSTELGSVIDGSGLPETEVEKLRRLTSAVNSVEGNYQAGPQGHSTVNNPSIKGKESREHPNSASTSDPKPSPSASSNPSSSKTSSQFSKQVSPVDFISEEYGTPSMIPLLSSDFHMREPYLDNWHMHPFPELAFSRQNHILANNQPFQSSFSSSVQTCWLCSGSSWSGNEISVDAVLVCGHMYHAECLEAVTPESSKFDPSCPVCIRGESSAAKGSEEGIRYYTLKVPGREADDIDANRNSILEPQKNEGQFSKNSRWLLFRNPSRGLRSPRLPRGSETSRRKKGLWARYR